MGLFGGSAKTTTTVRPAWQTEQILRDVASRSAANQADQRFVNHQFANMSPEYQGALSQLAASPELQQAAGILTGRTDAGLSNLSAANQAYQNIIGSPITAQQARDFSSTMTSPSSLSARTIGQGTSAGGAVRGLGGSAALRSAGRFNTGNIQAQMANTRGQQMTGMGASTLLGNQGYAQDLAGLQGRMAGTNLGLGAEGVQLGQQATMNQLQAGNIQQAYNQAQNQNTWQNQMGQQQFAWNQLNNRLNVLNQLSPMAGYTQTSTGAAPSTGSQLFGAGLAALGTYGKLGGFQGSGAQDLQGNYLNKWYNQGGTGAFNTVGNWFGGAK